MSKISITREQNDHILGIVRKHFDSPVNIAEREITIEVDNYLRSEYDQHRTEILLHCNIHNNVISLEEKFTKTVEADLLKYLLCDWDLTPDQRKDTPGE